MKCFAINALVILGCTAIGFAQNPNRLAVALDQQGWPTLSWQVQSDWVYRIETTTLKP
jgi:hypothetical protein